MPMTIRKNVWHSKVFLISAFLWREIYPKMRERGLFDNFVSLLQRHFPNERTRKIKRTIRGLFSLIFGLFQAKINTILTSCEKCQSSTRCHDSNPQPLDCKSHPITTRPVLIMKNCFIAFLRRFILTYSHFIIFVLRRQISSVINYLLSEKNVIKREKHFWSMSRNFFPTVLGAKNISEQIFANFFYYSKNRRYYATQCWSNFSKDLPKTGFLLKAFYSDHQSSWTLTPSNRMHVSIIHSVDCNRK